MASGRAWWSASWPTGGVSWCPGSTSASSSACRPRDGLELIEADLFDPDSVARVVAAGAAEAGAPLRAVVNLVGGFAAPGKVGVTPIEEFEAQFRLNLRPTYLVCQSALPHLVEAGGGSIVCVSTRAALQPFSGAAGYISSKAAILAFVKALAVEYRDDLVRANAILPSVIDTPGNRASHAEVRPFEVGHAGPDRGGHRLPVLRRFGAHERRPRSGLRAGVVVGPYAGAQPP